MDPDHEDVCRIKKANYRLRTLVEELTLEMNFYKAEAKRYKQESTTKSEAIIALKTRLSDSIDLLQKTSSTNLINNPKLVKSILKYPVQSISDVLQLQDTFIVVTSAQAPFFIEYSNKSWNVLCGWENAEVQGHTCAILQGVQSDMQICEALMKDIMLTGYGQMRNINYNKKDEPFYSTTTVFPIYDVPFCKDSKDGDEMDKENLPVITHLASVMTNVELIELDPLERARLKAEDRARMIRLRRQNANNPFYDTVGKLDRRSQSKRFPALMCISAENFLKNGENLRLSNLLRLMISSKDGIVLTDKHGYVVHTNKGWTDLTGYNLREVEGKTCKFLQGPRTDMTEVRRCNQLLRSHEKAEMTVFNYRKNGSIFKVRVIMLPIRGGLTAEMGVTHFVALLLPVSEIPDSIESICMEGNDVVDDASSLSEGSEGASVDDSDNENGRDDNEEEDDFDDEDMEGMEEEEWGESEVGEEALVMVNMPSLNEAEADVIDGEADADEMDEFTQMRMTSDAGEAAAGVDTDTRLMRCTEEALQVKGSSLLDSASDGTSLSKRSQISNESSSCKRRKRGSGN